MWPTTQLLTSALFIGNKMYCIDLRLWPLSGKSGHGTTYLEKSAEYSTVFKRNQQQNVCNMIREFFLFHTRLGFHLRNERDEIVSLWCVLENTDYRLKLSPEMAANRRRQKKNLSPFYRRFTNSYRRFTNGSRSFQEFQQNFFEIFNMRKIEL